MKSITTLYRKTKPSDYARITELCIQLGYDTTKENVLERLYKIDGRNDTAAFVSEENGFITGWIQVSVRTAIESEEFAEIIGLVVDGNYRGKGIGKELVLKAEEWSKNLGYKILRVRTNVKRLETHEFYKGRGFIETKRQTVFQKEL